MRRFLSRRPSLRLLAAPILLLAAFTVVGLMTDWIDWNTSKNCAVDKSSLSSAKFNSQRENRQRDEAGPNGATAHWREDSDRAYARSINESSFSSSRADVCRSVTASRADIDTMDVYPTLNFQVGIDCRLTINRWLLSGIFLFFFKSVSSNIRHPRHCLKIKMIYFFFLFALVVVLLCILNWKPEYMRRRDFWDSSLEKRYNDYRKDKTRPPLKVLLITKCFSSLFLFWVLI